MREYNRAELSLEAALNIDPGSVRARMTLGAVFFEQEEFEIASGVFREVISVHPELADAHLNLGLSLRAIGDMRQARKHLELVLKLRPDDPESEEIRRMLEDMTDRTQ